MIKEGGRGEGWPKTQYNHLRKIKRRARGRISSDENLRMHPTPGRIAPFSLGLNAASLHGSMRMFLALFPQNVGGKSPSSSETTGGKRCHSFNYKSRNYKQPLQISPSTQAQHLKSAKPTSSTLAPGREISEVCASRISLSKAAISEPKRLTCRGGGREREAKRWPVPRHQRL